MDQIIDYIDKLDTKFKLQLLSEKLTILLIRDDISIDRREITAQIEKERLKIKIANILKYYNLCLSKLKNKHNTFIPMYEEISNRWYRLRDRYKGLSKDNLMEIFLRRNVINQSLRFKYKSINTINDCISDIFTTTKGQFGSSIVIERTNGVESNKTYLPIHNDDEVIENSETKITIRKATGVSVSIPLLDRDNTIIATHVDQISQEKVDKIEFNLLSKIDKCKLIEECIINENIKVKDVVKLLTIKGYVVKYNQVYNLFNTVKSQNL